MKMQVRARFSDTSFGGVLNTNLIWCDDAMFSVANVLAISRRKGK